MPKMKTSKSAAKRIVKITRRGKIIRRKMSAQHRTKGKSKRTMYASNKETMITSANSKKIKKMVPYK